MHDDVKKLTIDDFGSQWSHYADNDGFYGSLDLFQDICGPLLELKELRGARVADLGSGTGRIVLMLLQAGVSHVTAVEPSEAVEVLRRNTQHQSHRVRVIRATAEMLNAGLDLDLVTAIGVIHHIPDPLPVLRAARSALRPGGRILIWVYGREGNAVYLRLVQPLRKITRNMPDKLLRASCFTASLPLWVYARICAWMPLPLRDYARGILRKLPLRKLELVIYDQLNPAYAKYYTQPELHELMQMAGFEKIRLYHRRGYSWTVIGEKGSIQ